MESFSNISEESKICHLLDNDDENLLGCKNGISADEDSSEKEGNLSNDKLFLKTGLEKMLNVASKPQMGVSQTGAQKSSQLQNKREVSNYKSIDSFESIVGVRLMNPLITSEFLRDKLATRKLVPFLKLKNHSKHGDLSEDWVVVGAVVSQSNKKVSKKGSNFCVWKLSDMKLGLKTASLFLFGEAYSNLWKRGVGTVVGVLNPSVMDSNEKESDEAVLSVFSSDRIMILGQSKDLGFCKARKKNGENCMAFVNKNHCEFCIFHVQKEYKKFSNRRSDLQSPTGGGLQNLRNKVLGKNEVFYAGKSFTATKPGKPVKTKQVLEKDKGLLKKLFNVNELSNKLLNTACEPSNEKVDLRFTRYQKIKDAERLAILDGSDSVSSPEQKNPIYHNKSVNGNKSAVQTKLNLGKSSLHSNISDKKTKVNPNDLKHSSDVSNNLFKLDGRKETGGCTQGLEIKGEKEMVSLSNYKSVKNSSIEGLSSPKLVAVKNSSFSRESLSQFFANKTKSVLPGNNSENMAGCTNNTILIDLSLPINMNGRRLAKMNALKYVKSNGPFRKTNPNGTRGQKTVSERKRTLDQLNSSEEQAENTPEVGNKAVLSDRFVELMNKSSKHEHLLNAADELFMDEYFSKMDKKEAMEEKMLNTFKIPCKAVKCIQCKYTWFSASDYCKLERHIIKVVDAMKRFFKCDNCGNRTVSLEVIPLLNCKQCGSANWKRAPVLSEKKTVANLNQLSIRGDEEKFISSFGTSGNINLLVPD